MMNYEVIEFTYMGEVYRYTTHRRIVQLLGKVFKPLAISRSAVVRSESSARDLEVEVPIDNEVASLYKKRSPDSTVFCTVTRINSGESLVYFQGFVAGVDFRAEQGDSAKALIQCSNDMQRMSRGGLGDTYTAHCNNDVYGERCGLDFDSMAVNTTVESVSQSGLVVTSSSLVGYPEDHFRAGLMRLGADVYRMIVRYDPVTGDIELFSPISGLVVGDNIAVAQGCNRSFAQCKQLGNTVNFIGFPWMPGDNIWADGVMRAKNID